MAAKRIEFDQAAREEVDHVGVGAIVAARGHRHRYRKHLLELAGNPAAPHEGDPMPVDALHGLRPEAEDLQQVGHARDFPANLTIDLRQPSARL